MIEKIIMDDVASYKEPVTITGLKRFNLFYGLNGVGKTILSQYLANSYQTENKFLKCSLKFAHESYTPEILVYNEDFVQKNFWSSNALKGIFTLDKDNAEAEQAITNARARIIELESEKESLNRNIQTLRSASQQNKEIFKKKVWQEKEAYENTALQDCMVGFMGSKENFLTKLLGSMPSNFKLDQSAEEQLGSMCSELDQLKGAGIQIKQPYSLLNHNLESVENIAILSERVVGSQDSYLSNLISKLNHADWVNQGITSYLDYTDDCPFCNRLMDYDLKQKIKTHIDKTYQSKLDELSSLKGTYSRNIEDLKLILNRYKVDDTLSNDQQLNSLISQLETLFTNNRNLLEKKLKSQASL